MPTQPVRSVTVIGAGTMGAGIAQVAAVAGCAVTIIDAQPGVVQRALDSLKKNLDRQVEKGNITTTDAESTIRRIKPLATINDLHDVDLAIEAVVEDLSVKQRIFEQLDKSTPDHAVLATNTSSLSVGKIAEIVRDPSRVIGMHFFNPAPLMPLVEIISTKATSPSAAALGLHAARAWGKVAVLAKDTPGFIVNRVARGFYLEALRLLGEGVGGVDEIDAIMRNLGQFKMGPFELMDLIGIDVNYSVSKSVWEQMGKTARFAPHEIQQSLVQQGHLGRKTGRGFYLHSDKTALPAFQVARRSFTISPLLADACRVFCEGAGSGNIGSTEQFIFVRILAAVLNEAAFALNEEVATREDIDLAMIKGTNYPKGPLAWAEQIGYRNVRGVLRALNQSVTDGRYEPAPLFANAV